MNAQPAKPEPQRVVPVTAAPPIADHHQDACDALERSMPLLLNVLRRAPGTVRPIRMRWTNAEIAAHMFASVTESEKAARSLASVYDAAGPTRELDEQMVAEVIERDPVVLADMIEEATASFLVTARALPGNQQLTPPRASVAALVGLLGMDHHLHGGQFAETTGTPWDGRVADMYAPFHAVLQYAFHPGRARGFHGSIALQLRGVAPVRFAVDDGQLHMDVAGRTDCKITADPQTFLRLGIGIGSQSRAVLSGKMRASGRKPWLALSVLRLFPPVPHGGVDR